jgi:hypothetical protein
LKSLKGKKLALAFVLIASSLFQSSASATTTNSLVVSYKQTPQSQIQKWTLKCNPTGGTLPQAKNACKQLLKIAQPFAAPDPDQMCSQIFESEEVATVKGSWKGKKISAKYSKTNSCEIARWAALKFLLQGSSPS